MPTVRFLVSDVEQALSFYVDLLGFEVVEQWGPPFAILQKDGLNLWLSGPDSSAQRPLADGTKPSPGGWNRIVVVVNDIEETLKVIKERGGSVRNAPISGPGGIQALVEDGVGNVVELFQLA